MTTYRFTAAVTGDDARTANLLDLMPESDAHAACVLAHDIDRDDAATLAAQLNAAVDASAALRALAYTVDDGDPLHGVIDTFDVWFEDLQGRPKRIEDAQRGHTHDPEGCAYCASREYAGNERHMA